jgi:hypothetical protein
MLLVVRVDLITSYVTTVGLLLQPKASCVMIIRRMITPGMLHLSNMQMYHVEWPAPSNIYLVNPRTSKASRTFALPAVVADPFTKLPLTSLKRMRICMMVDSYKFSLDVNGPGIAAIPKLSRRVLGFGGNGTNAEAPFFVQRPLTQT